MGLTGVALIVRFALTVLWNTKWLIERCVMRHGISDNEKMVIFFFFFQCHVKVYLCGVVVLCICFVYLISVVFGE